MTTQLLTMSDTSSMLGSTVDPRERAAHIACAVVLTVVVLAVIVALIVYFTTSPKDASCDNSDSPADPVGPSGEDPQPIIQQRMDAAKQVQKPRTVQAPKKVQPIKLAAKKTNLASATSFQSESGLMSAVSATGSSVQPAQGITTHPRMEGYSQSVASFTENYPTAMAAQNPSLNAVYDTQNSEHTTYYGNAHRGDLADKYTDESLFKRFAPEWRKNGADRFNQSQSYADFISEGKLPVYSTRFGMGECN